MNRPVYFVAAIPALVYIALNTVMPAQYRYLLESGLEKVWPFLISVAMVLIYSLLSVFLLATYRRLVPFATALITVPMLATLFAYYSVGHFTVLVIAVSMTSLAILVLAHVWCRRLSFDRPRLALVVILLSALSLFVAFAAAHAVSPIGFSRSVGAYAIFAVFCGLISVLALAGSLHPRVIPSVIAAFFAVYLLAPNDHGLPLKKAEGDPIGVNEALTSWIGARRDLDAYKAAHLPYPVIFVSAEGGGIYAAAHAYETLSILASRCPTFAQHVFVAVGVSGGAFGNALFNSSLSDDQNAYSPCSPGDFRIDTTPLREDHLSPVLGRLLLLEIVDRLVPGEWLERDRASMLTESFRTSSKNSDYLATAIGQSWQPTSARPALAAVSTNMRDGQRFVISPIVPTWTETTAEWWPSASMYSPYDISVIEAAGVSARFPWITPTARLRVSETADRFLADGGYFENSGADTVLDLINEMKAIANVQQYKEKNYQDAENSSCGLYISENFRKNVDWNGCSIHVFPIHLAITSSSLNPVERQEEADRLLGRADSSFLLDPVTTLLSTRSSRGVLALERASMELCGTRGGECISKPGGSLGFFVSYVSAKELELPLGWYISAEKIKRIEEQAVPAHAFSYRTEGNDNDNDISRLIFHLDMSLYGDDAELKVEDLLGSP
ncbi:hypothetical protein [Mesorhizobium sp. M0213]|uniref:hypothetical protein n=1 Tax=Mesorhizobium sp. M0213 TaxID=2956917 RepID=UPI00333616D9